MSDDRNYQHVAASAVDAVDLFVPGIKAAVKELEEKHGPLTPELYRAFTIFIREVGEVSDAVLDLTKLAQHHQLHIQGRTPIAIPEDVMEKAVQHLGHEIAQSIAVLVYMLINLFGDRIATEGEAPVLVPGKGTVQ